jgi:hypothetical protein
LWEWAESRQRLFRLLTKPPTPGILSPEPVGIILRDKLVECCLRNVLVPRIWRVGSYPAKTRTIRPGISRAVANLCPVIGL